jgi:hypothetical protein
MKANRRRSIAPLVPKLCSGWKQLQCFTPSPPCTRRKSCRYPMTTKLGAISGPYRYVGYRKNLLLLPEIKLRVIQLVDQSAYRLICRGSLFWNHLNFSNNFESNFPAIYIADQNGSIRTFVTLLFWLQYCQKLCKEVRVWRRFENALFSKRNLFNFFFLRGHWY